MFDALSAAIPAHGPLVLFVMTFLACLAVPFPVSLLMLTAGALVGRGVLDGPSVVVAALAGSLLGDQAGFCCGRVGGTRLWNGLLARPRSAALAARAGAALHQRAFASVFLSRWLFSPLGPWVNFAAGATLLHWQRFSVAAVLGKALWVALYVGLGYVFASRIDQVGPQITTAIGVAALVGGVGTALWVWLRRMRRMRRGAK